MSGPADGALRTTLVDQRHLVGADSLLPLPETRQSLELSSDAGTRPALSRILADFDPSDRTIRSSKPSRAVIIDGCNDYWFIELHHADVYRKARKANVLLIVSHGATQPYKDLENQTADYVLVPTKYAVWDQVKPIACAAGLSVQCKNLCLDDDTDGTGTLAQLEDGNYLVFAKDDSRPKLMCHYI
ncbi:hypothetical protein [Mollivirus kamchatka]|nr:hypothetical protein [Mollivirus kamchatka]